MAHACRLAGHVLARIAIASPTTDQTVAAAGAGSSNRSSEETRHAARDPLHPQRRKQILTSSALTC